jgi:GT2 family glycosyltransferase
MQAFEPYTIRHLQLTQAVPVAIPDANTYLVFWWQKVPLGHLWMDDAMRRLAEPALRQQIINAVAPALHYYFSNQSVAASWQAAFLQGNSEPLRHLLETNAVLQTFSNPHAGEKISVVICTRNRTAALEQCISALLQSSDTGFELVIVDNAPDDDSTEKLMQRFPEARYVREPRKGLDIARNTGAQSATCAIVAYTDDDVTVDADWIKNVKACFADPKTACVTGLVIPIELQTQSQYQFEKHWGFNKGYVPLVFDDAYFQKHKEKGVPVWDIGAGANMAFRKSLFEKIGYFDERLDVGAAGCSGDSEYWYRALAEGFQCNYFPHLFVYHQHRTSKAELDKQIFYYMRGQVASLLVQYERYGHRGNLKRLYSELPKWYRNRLRNKLQGRYSPVGDSLFTEIRGCISGWRFYRAHRAAKAAKN